MTIPPSAGSASSRAGASLVWMGEGGRWGGGGEFGEGSGARPQPGPLGTMVGSGWHGNQVRAMAPCVLQTTHAALAGSRGLGQAAGVATAVRPGTEGPGRGGLFNVSLGIAVWAPQLRSPENRLVGLDRRDSELSGAPGLVNGARGTCGSPERRKDKGSTWLGSPEATKKSKCISYPSPVKPGNPASSVVEGPRGS